MVKRLLKARTDGAFPMQECDLEDLAVVARMAPKGLGSGEVSCISIAYRIRSIAFMTDEKKARKFALEKLRLHVETTPKLYAWLHYNGYLSDSDHQNVIREHEIYEVRPLTMFLQEAFNEAMRCRLMQRNSMGTSET
jgi:predicted nucleic acid-binding protein